MKKEVADQWVAALRSGRYKQGCKFLSSDGRYCCLGVLCELCPDVESEEFTGGNGKARAYGRGSRSEIYILPRQVSDWAGMRSNTGARVAGRDSLWVLNDSGISFKQIADIIEQEWEDL